MPQGQLRRHGPSTICRSNGAMSSQMFNMYALKMASVFMISLSTLWLRAGVMPRWLSYISYAVALLMLFSLSLSVWMVLWFPTWVLVVSTYFLIMSYRQAPAGEEDGAPPVVASS
jgi:hypothetical protein